MSDQTQTTKRIIRINASSLREASCLLRWKRTIIDGYYQETKGAALVYGVAVHKYIDTEYRRSKVFQFSDETLAEFRATLVELCKQLSASLQADHFPRTGITTGACEGKWGLCQYYVPCTTSGPLVDVIMKRDFKQKPYDPLKHNEL